MAATVAWRCPEVTRGRHSVPAEPVLRVGAKNLDQRVGVRWKRRRLLCVIQRQWAVFSTVKKKLRDLAVEYSMQFPGWLRVITPVGVQFFLTPQEAWSRAEFQPGLSPSGKQQDGKRRCHARARGGVGAMKCGSPTVEEVQQGKLTALEEVASFSGKVPGGRTQPPPSANASSDSDNDLNIRPLLAGAYWW
ncbi:hypothetical protein NDU88_001679 [Pleurodeles waltl]|uniref:Uncharacterized protein n=1 Tax=Pleurodeles waltl TaxID=8319 RepID=A0AAV7KTH7_PLEWA|nr:hypothetical protein NDU88_001679 [Pleurodeles waltl]